MKVELSDVPMTAALVKRHEAETAAIPMNPPPLLLMQHATRQAIELLEHAAFLERRCARPEALRSDDVYRRGFIAAIVAWSMECDDDSSALKGQWIAAVKAARDTLPDNPSAKSMIDAAVAALASVPSPLARSQEKE